MKKHLITASRTVVMECYACGGTLWSLELTLKDKVLVISSKRMGSTLSDRDFAATARNHRDRGESHCQPSC